jgi:hypothetical protein
MSAPPSDAELLAYRNEALPLPRLAEIERMLADSPELRARLHALMHSVHDETLTLRQLWREYRLSCLSRSQLRNHLLGILDDGWSGYIKFHLDVVECAYCRANRDDLMEQCRAEPETKKRRERVFASSAGCLKADARG